MLFVGIFCYFIVAGVALGVENYIHKCSLYDPMEKWDSDDVALVMGLASVFWPIGMSLYLAAYVAYKLAYHTNERRSRKRR